MRGLIPVNDLYKRGCVNLPDGKKKSEEKKIQRLPNGKKKISLKKSPRLVNKSKASQ